MRRLELYLAYLRSLPGGDHNVSATTIAGALGLGEVQVRKDLAKIAGEGRRRTGRSRDRLIANIEHSLRCTCPCASVLVGTELPDCRMLDGTGVHVMACFALDPKAKCTPCGLPIYSLNRLETFCKHYDVNLGIIAVPMENAQAVCDGLIACGIQSIWNLSPARLTVPQGIQIKESA